MRSIEWKCGNCGKIYNTDEFLRLDKVKLVECDIDPIKEHGYTSVCKCGYRFHLDKWRLNDSLKIKIKGDDREILISTIYLELNHGYYDEDLWFETMIFIEDIEGKYKIECYYENRYETKNDAIEDHNRILNLLKDGKYVIEEIDETNDGKILYIKENTIRNIF